MLQEDSEVLSPAAGGEVEDVEELFSSSDPDEMMDDDDLDDFIQGGVEEHIAAQHQHQHQKQQKRYTHGGGRAKASRRKRTKRRGKKRKGGALSAARGAALVISQPSEVTAGDAELEMLRKEIVAIILGSRLYKTGTGRSPNVREQILSVLAQSSLSSTAAHALLFELEATMQEVLPLV